MSVAQGREPRGDMDIPRSWRAPEGRHVEEYRPSGAEKDFGCLVPKVTPCATHIDAINTVMLERDGMGRTGETYMVQRRQ